MKSLTACMLLLLVSQALCEQVCQPPQYVSRFFRVNGGDTYYVFRDYDQNKILLVFGETPQSERWSLLDLNTKMTYENFGGNDCRYLDHRPDDERNGYELFNRCLPSDGNLLASGEVVVYSYERPTAGINWVVGMRNVPDTDFYTYQFSRLLSAGTDGVGLVDIYGVVFDTIIGQPDPAVFNKDLSVCVPGSSVQ